jgi:YtkA-like
LLERKGMLINLVRNFLWVTGFFILLITLSACQRGSSKDIPEIGIELTVSPNPPSVGAATVSLALSDVDGRPIEGATVELEGNMSHAGMAPVFAQAGEVEPGHYEAPFQFTMGGDWFILVKATLPDGRRLERQMNLPGVTSR